MTAGHERQPSESTSKESRTIAVVTAADVYLLRSWLLDDLRKEHQDPTAPTSIGSPSMTETIGSLSPAEARTALAWTVVDNRVDAGLSSEDVLLWIETSGLRGVRISVTDMARDLQISARQAHRRIRQVDCVVAGLLSDLPPGGFYRRARRPKGSQCQIDDAEMLTAVYAECFSMPDTRRALDAVRMYARNQRPTNAVKGRPAYLAGNKDDRYRDAKRVAEWINTLAHNPPVPSTTPSDRATLAACRDIELSTDPQVALQQIRNAISTNQREALPLLIAHAGRLVSDADTAGVSAWLDYLQLRFHAAMESEHITALRYARALQANATRFSPAGVADPQVRKGIAGRGHVLQMFGHYDAALRCYHQSVRHAVYFPPADHGQLEDLHDAYAQIAYTEALRRGNRSHAMNALRHVNQLADQQSDVIEIQFTRARRILEVAISFGVRSESLTLAPLTRRAESLVENSFAQFSKLTDGRPSVNRMLAAQDIKLLYAIATRDAGLAKAAREEYQRVNDIFGGYANLTDRFNRRLREAANLSKAFRDLPAVSGPSDPLRVPAASPQRPTGLLAYWCSLRPSRVTELRGETGSTAPGQEVRRRRKRYLPATRHCFARDTSRRHPLDCGHTSGHALSVDPWPGGCRFGDSEAARVERAYSVGVWP